MLLSSFLEGLSLAYKAYEMHQIDLQLTGLQTQVDDLKGSYRDVQNELDGIRETIDRVSTFQQRLIRDDAIKMLGAHGLANSTNVDAVSIFMSSLSSHILGIVFKGEIAQKKAWGSSHTRGFFHSIMGHQAIMEKLADLSGLKKFTGARIETNIITSCAEMKAMAVAIGSFFKILEIFKLNTCPLTDAETMDGNCEVIIRFERQYGLKDYIDMKHHINNTDSRLQISKTTRKNVYVLGKNGCGKSTWANLIANKKVFEEGINHHTTMLPQAVDVEGSPSFRLWDMPGLFDGSAAQAHMEECMNFYIDLTGYCSGVLFIFSGSVPPDDTTNRVLNYALEHFGEHVKWSFVAVINSFDANAQARSGLYADKLHEYGFQLSTENFFVSDGKETSNAHAHIIRTKLSEYNAELVSRHRKAYDTLLQEHGNVTKVIHHLHKHSRKQLSAMLKQGNIETKIETKVVANADGTACKRHIIIFRQYSRAYLLRKLGLHAEIKDERKVLISGCDRFIYGVRDRLKIVYQFQKKDVFLNHILPSQNSVLIHTPEEEYDYELRDLSGMSMAVLRSEVYGHLFHQVNPRERSYSNLTQRPTSCVSSSKAQR